MKYPLNEDPVWRLGTFLGNRVRQHRYMMVSMALHAVLLTLLYYFGSYVIEIKQQQAQVNASVQAASHTRTEKRVQDMEKIKSLLEKSSLSKAAGAAIADPDDEVAFSATSLPKTPKELLAEAKALSKSIDEVARELKAEQLAKVLKIPKEKAIEQIPAPPAVAELPPDEVPAEPAQVAQEIQKLEAKAREQLIERQHELERKEQGVAVARGADSASASGQAGQAGSGAAGSGSAGSGTAGMGAGAAKGGAGGDNGSGSISGQMATFINRDLPMPGSPSKSHSLGNEIIHSGSGSIPALETKLPNKGMGRTFGAGGQVASRVYVNSWYLIGPFEGKRGHDLLATPSYPPEQAVLLDAVYFGKDKRLLRWKYVHASSYPLVPPDPAEDAVYYGYTELMMDEAVDLTMAIGADDDAQVWLNDRMVWVGGNVNKRWFYHDIYYTRNSNGYLKNFNFNEGTRKVHFKKGRNKVFFKLSNGQSRVFFSMVLTK